MSKENPGAFAHLDILRVATGLFELSQSDMLTEAEERVASSAAASLETLADAYWTVLDALAGTPLPDPGTRPDARTIYPYSDKDPNLNDALGYFHRCREFLARALVKYEDGYV